MGESNNTLSTVHRTFRIVETIREMDGARPTEIADELDIPVSTLHKYLKTLENERFLIQKDNYYYLGLEFLNLGMYTKSRKESYNICSKKVSEIAQETGERAQFVVEEHGYGIYIDTEAANKNAVMINRRDGINRKLHATASGKAILSQLPKSRVKEIISQRGLPAETENTITDENELFDELKRIQEMGISYNDEESVKGLRAIGVPVRQSDGQVLGAFSASGPCNRLRKSRFREEIPDVLLGYANEVELNLRYK